MKYQVNSWDEFQPLETVIVGSTYDSSFFDGVKNKKISDVLKKICDETNEDIEYFKQQMRSHNIDVLSATPTELGYKTSILDYADVNGKIGYNSDNPSIIRDHLIPIHPLQVRDDSIVMGNKILVTDKTFEVHGYVEKYKEWFGEDQLDLSIYNGNLKFKRTLQNLDEHIKTNNTGNLSDINSNEVAKLIEENTMAGFCSPNITRIGTKCLVDTWQTDQITNFLKNSFPEFNYQELVLGGHNDSIFCVLKPGLVIAGPWFKGYESNFKDWEVIYFNDPNWDKAHKWYNLKRQNKGKWWVPGQEDNNEFTGFVESFLSHWTGYVEETIFDLNCLVIDDRYVVTSSNSQELYKVLEQHNLTPIYCPLRNRFFWDGGWHCLTLDVKRKGSQNDYGL